MASKTVTRSIKRPSSGRYTYFGFISRIWWRKIQSEIERGEDLLRTSMLLPSHVRFKIKWCLCLRLFQLSFWLASFGRPTCIKLPLACTLKVRGRLMEFNCISQTFISRFANYYNYYCCCCCCYCYYCYYYYYLILLSCICQPIDIP